MANGAVSGTWLSNFAANHPEVSKQRERNADACLTKKQNEGTVEKHFYGEYGVVASLTSMNNIDLSTGMIIDPRRIVWFDEMPQVMDAANQGPRSKAWGVTGEALERAGSVNRETGSVGMCFSLDGFLYGPQFNVGRENWTCALADCLNAPAHAKRFDSQIYTLDAKSTYALMSKTANGVQTGESFKQLLASIAEQTRARSAAEVAAGRPPIEFPIFFGTDNHGSRFSPEVLQACGPYAADTGIRMVMEEAKTSQFLQPPNQVTKLCHGAYIRGRKQYQKLHKKIYGEPATIGIVEFIEIWGGCRELGYEGAWFSWANAQILLGAWRNCGWLGCVIAPEDIDRSPFIDQPAAAAQLQPAPVKPAITYEQANTVPEGMEPGSLAAAQAQVAALQQYIEENTHSPFDPVAAGVMVARTAEAKKRTRDKTRIDESEGGDAHLRNLAESALEKQQAKKLKADGVAARKEERAEKLAQLETSTAARRQSFESCTPNCTCGEEPCPWAKMHLCLECGDIKGTVCRKKACVEKQAPLLLTMGPLGLN